MPLKIPTTPLPAHNVSAMPCDIATLHVPSPTIFINTCYKLFITHENKAAHHEQRSHRAAAQSCFLRSRTSPPNLARKQALSFPHLTRQWLQLHPSQQQPWFLPSPGGQTLFGNAEFEAHLGQHELGRMEPSHAQQIARRHPQSHRHHRYAISH